MKAYVKPELFYERYELSKHIADCGIEFKNSTKVEECYAVADPNFELGLGTAKYFNGGVECEAPLDAYCYTNGTEGWNTFVS